MIFANHAHVFPKELRPEATAEKLIEFMDECGIDKAVAFAPFDDRFHEGGFEGSQNVWLANEIKGMDRLVGFGTIDFHNNLRDEVDRIADLGLKGIKMHPPYQEFVIDGPEAFEVYEAAQEWEQAEKTLEQVAEIRKEMLDEDNPLYLNTLEFLARVCMKQKKFEKAIRLYQEKNDVNFEETKVGDRYVLEEMRRFVIPVSDQPTNLCCNNICFYSCEPLCGNSDSR